MVEWTSKPDGTWETLVGGYRLNYDSARRALRIVVTDYQVQPVAIELGPLLAPVPGATTLSTGGGAAGEPRLGRPIAQVYEAERKAARRRRRQEAARKREEERARRGGSGGD